MTAFSDYPPVRRHDRRREPPARRGDLPNRAPRGPGHAGDPPHAKPEERAEKRGLERILLVEDEPMVRRLAHRTLEEAGYTVKEASHGEQALEVARRSDEPIDLLVTDVVMPRMSGAKLVAELTAERPGLRVMFVSGYAESVIATEGSLPEGADFLPKPFTARKLRDRVREALDRPAPIAQRPTDG